MQKLRVKLIHKLLVKPYENKTQVGVTFKTVSHKLFLHVQPNTLTFPVDKPPYVRNKSIQMMPS